MSFLFAISATFTAFFVVVAGVLFVKKDKDASISVWLASIFAFATLLCHIGKTIQDKGAEPSPSAIEARR